MPTAVQSPRTNGVVADRRLPVRTTDVSFEWEGVPWHATMRIDAPSGVVDDFFAADNESLKRALGALVRAWDFVDEDGEPVPLPKDGGIAKVPYPLLSALVGAYLEALAPPKDSDSDSETS